MKIIVTVFIILACNHMFSDEISKAIEDGKLPLLKSIVDADPGLVNKEIEYSGYPIIIAAGHGNVEIVKYLLEKGANVDVRSTETGENVILRMTGNLENFRDAKFKKFSEIISMLAEKKAAFNLVDKNGRGPLLILAGGISNSSECARNQLEIARLLVKYGAKFSDAGNKGALIAMLGNRISKGPAGENELDVLGMTKEFVELGADVNETDKETGNTPLITLLQNSSIPDDDKVGITVFLLEKGANKNAKNKKKQKPDDLVDKRSPLEDALKKTKPKK